MASMYTAHFIEDMFAHIVLAESTQRLTMHRVVIDQPVKDSGPKRPHAMNAARAK